MGFSNSMNGNKSLREISFVTIGSVVSRALQAIFYLIVATLLEPELYGEMSYLIAIAGTFSLFSRFGLNQTITVYQAKEKVNLSNQINVLAAITSVGAAIVLLFINEYAAILCLGLSFFVMNQHNLLGLKKYKRGMFYAITKGLLILAVSLPLFYVFDIPGILLGLAISNFIASFDFIKSLRKIQSFNLVKQNFKVIFHNFGVDVSTNLPRIVDKLLIAPLFGFFFVGIYQFNMQILFALEILPIVLYTFLLSEESSGKEHKKIIMLMLIGSVLLTIVSVSIAPIVIENWFPKYIEGIFPLQILVISLIPLSITSIFSAKLQAKESTNVGLSAIVRIGSLLGLIALLGNLYGLLGLSLAVLLSVCVNAIFMGILYKKEKIMNYNFEILFN